MATEKITLSDIKNRSTADYEWLRSGHPLSGYSEVVGPPISSILSSDETGVTIETTTYFEGRLLKTEFRLAKDLQALADIVDNINSPAHSGPHEFILISENDTEAGYLDAKIIDGEGTLATIISESDGIEELKIDVRTKHTIEIDNDFLQLDGDETTPGALHYYGTNVAGNKGWYGFTEIPMPAVTITDQDESSDYLNEKVSDGEGIFKTITETSNGEQTLDFSVRVKRSIDIDSDFLQFENDENAPGNSKFYGTTTGGVKGWQSFPIKNSIELDSEQLQLENDESSPGNSKFYGTTTGGTKGWQNIPVKNSIEQDAEQLQFVNDIANPGTSRYYGTDLVGTKGWHVFSSSTSNTVSVAIDDASSGFLNDKLIDGEGILTTQNEESDGTQTLDVSVQTKNSIEIDSDFLQFVNDENTPGNSKFYGTDLSGVKGWHSFIDAHLATISITVGDVGSGYLDDKVVDGDGILTTLITDSTGDQTLDVSVQTKNSIEIDSDFLQFENDELAPGNSKFYGTTTGGVKGWQDLPIKNSIELDSEQLQLVNDANAPGNQKYYGTDINGIKGFHTLAGGAVSINDEGSGYLEDKIEGHQSVNITKENDSAFDEVLEVRLVSDETNPGNHKFYGTDESGIKGWHDREFFTNTLGLGGFPDVESIGNDFPVLRRCSIHPDTGVVSNVGVSGDDVVFSGNGTSADQQIIASKVWNNVWNDMADFQDLGDDLLYGKCYYDTINGAKICNVKCQESVIGIASNTFGYALGSDKNKVPIAVSGWVLACVDKEYKIGTPLTNDINGNLTEMTLEEKQNYPERIVAIYKKKEEKEYWGPEGKQIDVNGRHWVKVK